MKIKIISVKVKPGAKFTQIEQKNNQYIVSLTERPEKGKANHQLIKILADFFNVSKSQIDIRKGFTNKQKLIHITTGKLIRNFDPQLKNKKINFPDKKKNYLSRVHCWDR